MAEERIQKILADYGLASRRRCEEYIRSGRVEVNGVKANLGDKACRQRDELRFDGQPLQLSSSQDKLYLMMNKPAGYVTTVKDEGGRATVMDLLPKLPKRVFPVGRLDRDTEGLLIFTDDGDLAYQLTHPSHLVEKEYIAEVSPLPGPAELALLTKGVRLDDGLTSPAQAKLLGQNKLSLIIREGRKRQVRRMLAAVGSQVLSLRRVRVGQLLVGQLPLGSTRYLSSEEVEALRSLSDLKLQARGEGHV